MLLVPSSTAPTVAITGHRPQSLDGDFSLTAPLWQWLRATLPAVYDELGVDTVVQGMAVGADQLAGFLALEHGRTMHAAVPFDGQADRWPQLAVRRWQWLADRAHELTVVSPGGYAAWKMHARNEWMVKRSDALIAVWNGARSGGTAACVAYAHKVGRPVVRLDPFEQTVEWSPAA